MNNAFTAPHFQSHELAREWLEKQRWPDGPVCSHCGTINHSYKNKAKPGYFRCAEKECRKDFTVTTGTLMERSHIALNKWLMAFYLMSSSKKGISAHQLHRALNVDYKSAWFLCHRIREAMREGVGPKNPMGGSGKIIEADETYFGSKDVIRKRTKRGKSSHSSKRSVLGLVERGGKVRMFHVERADAESVREIIVRNVSRESDLHTDESRLYTRLGTEFASHDTVIHSGGEYVRYTDKKVIHTNTIENVFSVFKRGMKGTYQHCGEGHLHRYLAEFDFRYNRRSALGVTDTDRASDLVKGTSGKRLLYRRPDDSGLVGT